jgi:ESX secretion-associated protein EspJ
MTGQFHLDSSGLTPLSDIHAQVAQGLGQLVSGGGPQASDVAKSFGNIAFGLNSALDGATQSRTSTLQSTKTSADTIKDLLTKAHQMYLQGDEQGADKLKAAAEALQASEGGGSSGAGGAGGSTGAGATGAGAAGGGSPGKSGGEMASQIASQVGQQVGQIAQGLTQSVQGLAQGLTQLPQQLMQGLQGLGGSAAQGAGSQADKAHVAAKQEKADEDKDTDEHKDGKPDDERAAEQRGRPSAPPAHADEAQAGPNTDGGRAPVAPAPTERPQPAQTRPQ